MTNMIKVISDRLKELPELSDVTIKAYYRPEILAEDDSSLVIIPMSPPKQASFGSDIPLRKEFTFQFNIEASSRDEVTRIALAMEKILLQMGFYQLSGGLDEYFVETKRYVDARRFRGYSMLYDADY